jgi:hypothetical protein
LTNDMKVLVQHKIRVAHELLTVDREQNSIRPSCRAHAQMSPRISRVLYDDNSADWLAKYSLERERHWRRQHIATPEERTPFPAFYSITTQWPTASPLVRNLGASTGSPAQAPSPPLPPPTFGLASNA